MELITRAAVCGVLGSLLALLLRRYTPELSVLTTASAGAVIVWLSVSVCSRIVETMKEIARRSGVEAIYVSPVLKCVGIGVVTHMAAQLCRDAGQGSISSAIELCGTLCAVYVSLPLLESLLVVVEQLL